MELYISGLSVFFGWFELLVKGLRTVFKSRGVFVSELSVHLCAIRLGFEQVKIEYLILLVFAGT